MHRRDDEEFKSRRESRSGMSLCNNPKIRSLTGCKNFHANTHSLPEIIFQVNENKILAGEIARHTDRHTHVCLCKFKGLIWKLLIDRTKMASSTGHTLTSLPLSVVRFHLPSISFAQGEIFSRDGAAHKQN